MEEYKCRTCLEVTRKQTCTLITEKCVDKSIKLSIIQLVPEMRSTLMDNEVVCINCLRTLQSCMEFINRCIKIEIDIQESITIQLEALNHLKYDKDNWKNVNLDHDYIGATENEVFEDFESEVSDLHVSEVSDLDISELNDLPLEEEIKIQYFDDDNDSMTSFKEYSEENDLIDISHNEQLINLNKINSQENSTSVECQTCKAIFSDVDSLKNHEMIHGLTCKICSLPFSNEKDLIAHKRVHAPFICEKCGRSFAAESHRDRHQSVHMEKECMCEVCGKKFPNNSALGYHMVSHRQERSFLCSQCPKKYKSYANLKRHEKQYHEKMDQQQCQRCGIIVRGRQAYAKHYRQASNYVETIGRFDSSNELVYLFVH